MNEPAEDTPVDAPPPPAAGAPGVADAPAPKQSGPEPPPSSTSSEAGPSIPQDTSANIPGATSSVLQPDGAAEGRGEEHSPPSAAEPPPPPPAPEPTPLRFHGDAREYFRIWIVNTLLTIVTCGIYAAWAKVRRRRYFRGNTELLGHRFDYTADPRRLLIGNLIVAVLFLAYAVFGGVYRDLKLVAAGLGWLLLPWVVLRSASFNAYHTVHRGLRFRFKQGYAMPVLLFLLGPFAIAISLGLFYPRWQQQWKKWLVSSHRFGTAFFEFKGKTGPFYLTYLIASVMMLVPSFGVGAYAAISGRLPLTGTLPGYILLGAQVVALYVARAWIYGNLFNHVWNNTHLDDHRFVAKMEVERWMNMQVVNLLVLVGTLGLAYPWTAVRNARYTVSRLSFLPGPGFDRIEHVASRAGAKGALGETSAEFFGLDFGL